MNTTPKQYHIIPAPFIKRKASFNGILKQKLLAVLILSLTGIYFWGIPALIMYSVAVITALCIEICAWKLMGDNFETKYSTYSTILIGLSFALFLPVNTPLWIIVLGVSFSLIFGKIIFGGIAYTPFPPVAVGYSMIYTVWPQYLNPAEVILETSLADPLAELKLYGINEHSLTLMDFLSGNQLTVSGATSFAVVLCVLAFMLIRKIVRYELALGYSIGIILLSYGFYSYQPTLYASPILFLSTGTVMLSLILLLSDFSSIPASGAIPRFVYGLLIGVLLVLFRTYTNIIDATPLVILLASFLVPYVDMLGKRPVGIGKK